MSSEISLVAAGLGAIVAAVGGGVLLARCFRAPRPDIIAWSIALIGLLVSLGAQVLGYLAGYDGAIFRAMAIGGMVIAPLAVTLGLSEIAAKGLGARFCARVYICAVAIVAVVVLYLDQLAAVAFTKSWPNPHTYYQSPPNYVVYATSVVTIVIAGIAAIVVIARSGRRPGWDTVLGPQLAAAAAAMLLAYPGVALLLRSDVKVSLPLTSLFTPLLAIAAGLILAAGVQAGRHDVAALHGRAGAGHDASPGGRGRGDTGDFGPGGHRAGISGGGSRGDYARLDNLGRPGEVAGWSDGGRHGTGYPTDQTGDFDRYDDSGVYGGLYRPDAVPEKTGHGQPGPDDSSYEYSRQDRDRYGDELDAGYQTGDFDPGLREPGGHPGQDEPGGQLGPDHPGAGRRAADQPSRKDLFGQIAIYTLLEDRIPEFDQLTERVVAEVRSREPDTLVFNVHAVPSAPMQRILYEVYRDRTAYEWHRQQPYVTKFESDRRPYVLATNVIELGLQQAKVSPFPSVAELFGEPGSDTSGFERPDYLRDYGRPPASHGDSRGGSQW